MSMGSLNRAGFSRARLAISIRPWPTDPLLTTSPVSDDKPGAEEGFAGAVSFSYDS